MVICVFDTETTSLNKPFAYNIGYVLYDTEQRKKIVSRDFVVEQVWHNPMLFTTAYYADKRPQYVQAMRAHSTIMDKFGYITQRMYFDFKAYSVKRAYAYNSDFDERVFAFNCDWFKCINPFDNVSIHDIRGFAQEFLINEDFRTFCESNGYFTDSGNYSTTAETMYRFITNHTDFIEDHTALSDSEIELDILLSCVDKGADIETDYVAKKIIPRQQERDLRILFNKKELFSIKYKKMTINRDRTKISITGVDE